MCRRGTPRHLQCALWAVDTWKRPGQVVYQLTFNTMLDRVPYDRESEGEELRMRIRDHVDDLHDETTYALRLLYELETALNALFKMESEVK